MAETTKSTEAAVPAEPTVAPKIKPLNKFEQFAVEKHLKRPYAGQIQEPRIDFQVAVALQYLRRENPALTEAELFTGDPEIVDTAYINGAYGKTPEEMVELYNDQQRGADDEDSKS